MFGWIRKRLSPVVVATSADDQKALGERLRVEEVMDAFLDQNPQPTPFMVHALVAAGATHLPDSDAVDQVCQRIEKHGYQYPLNPTLRRQLEQGELLSYLRWHVDAQVDQESYRDDNTITQLVQRFRKERGSE